MRMMFAEWWRQKLPLTAKTFLPAAVLFGISAFVSHKLFTTEYLPYLGSIEGAYIGLSRYILEHFGEFRWFPLWYGGIPFENAYPPLLHFAVAALSWLTGFSPALAHHVAAGLVYCLSPVTVFLLAYRLSQDRTASFAAGLFYTVVSTSTFLIPKIVEDVQVLWAPRRLQTIVVYSDTPHHASLLLLPVALLCLDWVIERVTVTRFFAAVFAFVSIALTNWLGSFAATLAVIAYVLARGNDRCQRTLTVTAAVGVTAYAVASPWIPPSQIATIRHNAQYVVSSYVLGTEQLIYALILIAATAALAWLLHQISDRVPLRFAALFMLLTGVLPIMLEYTGRYIVPQPDRYHIVMEMAIALFIAFLLTPVVRRRRPIIRYVFVGLALLVGVRQVYLQHVYADAITRSVEIEETVEHQIATSLQENLPGKRVFVTGSIRYWLNAFSDSPQFGGGFDQGVYNDFIRAISFSVPFLEGDGARSVAWLKAYGVHAVVVGGPESRNFYHEFRDPGKFEGLLPEIWRDGDDVIYAVPQRTNSLARVILPEQVVKRPPINGTDISPALRYVRGLEDETLPAVSIDWDAPHHGVIDANLQPSHLISVQISYHPGWEASVDADPLEIREDGLGLMLLEPGCNGPCHIELTYTGGLEMALAKASRGLVLVLGIAWAGAEWKRRKASRSA